MHPWQDVAFEAFLSACFPPEALVSQWRAAERGCSAAGLPAGLSGREWLLLLSCLVKAEPGGQPVSEGPAELQEAVQGSWAVALMQASLQSGDEES